MTKTKADLVNAVVTSGSVTNPIDAEKAVQTILDTIALTLASGDRIELRDFGVFDVRDTAERVSNLNGATIPAGTKVTFKMGKRLGEIVNA